MRIAQGATAYFEAAFYTPESVPAVLDEAPTVEFFLQDDTPALVGQSAVVIPSTDTIWQAVVTVPDDEPLGWHKIVWTGAIGGDPVTGTENFEITGPGSVILDIEQNLRLRLADKIPEGGSDADSFFTNDEVHSLLALAGGDLYRAAFAGWTIKMAFFSDAVDINESGSDRKLSQLFKQAKMMADFYRGEMEKTQSESDASLQLPTAQAFTLRTGCNDVFGYGYSPFSWSTTSPYVRIFLSKRFISYYDTIYAGGWMR